VVAYDIGGLFVSFFTLSMRSMRTHSLVSSAYTHFFDRIHAPSRVHTHSFQAHPHSFSIAYLVPFRAHPHSFSITTSTSSTSAESTFINTTPANLRLSTPDRTFVIQDKLQIIAFPTPGLRGFLPSKKRYFSSTSLRIHNIRRLSKQCTSSS